MPIYELSNSTHDMYQRLCMIVHRRTGQPEGLQIMTESLIDEAQNYLLELLKLKNDYFKEHSELIW
jgi:hypothetical protein